MVHDLSIIKYPSIGFEHFKCKRCGKVSEHKDYFDKFDCEEYVLMCLHPGYNATVKLCENCECGSTICGSPFHSDWCPKYEK